MTPLLLDINAPEFVLLLVLAVVLFGPERLPDLARKAARVLRYVRTMASSAQDQLSRELGPGFEDVNLRDLNPRAFVQKHLLDDVEPVIADVKSEINDVGRSVTSSSRDISSAIDRAGNADDDDWTRTSDGGPEEYETVPDYGRTSTPYDAEAT